MLPQILFAVLFLCALHARYTNLLNQFLLRFKVPEDASLNSVVEDVRYHDSFTLAGLKKSPTPPGSWVPKVSTANIDKQGNNWANPFEWLSKYGEKGIKTRWTRALASMGICLICHCAEKAWHVPANCPFLKEVNLKLAKGPPSPSPPAPAPVSLASVPHPSPGRSAASANIPPVGFTGSGSAPSGLMALAEEYELDNNFRWDGD
jgi:hypothetical protein